MRLFLPIVVSLVIGILCVSGCDSPSKDVDAFYAVVDTAWAFRSIARPLDSDSVSRNDGLRDMSPEAIAHRQTFWQEIVQDISTLDPSEFQSEDRMNYRVFDYIARDELAHYTHQVYLRPFNAEGGFHTGFGFVPSGSAFKTEEDYHKYISKLNGFAQYVDEHIALLRSGVEVGKVLPKAIMKDFDLTAMAFVSTDIEESVFYAPVGKMPDSFDDQLRIDLTQMVRKAITENVEPAYRKLAVFLREEYYPECSETIGITSIPGGKALYEQRIQYFTTLDLTADAVYEKGLSEVARIKEEMLQVIGETGFDGTFPEFLQMLRTDPRFYAKTPHELLAEASYFSKKIDGKLPGYFGKLPRLPYGVEPVPDQIAPRYTGGRYVPGSYKRNRAGTYWVNTYKLDSRPLYILPSLTLHEAVPGHHLQMMLAAEAENPVEFRNQYYISAFGEGWALYTEWLGKEMGIYETPYQRFGALTYEMWRACRLVVDPGMHARGWSRQQAVEYMTNNTALSIHEINTEIDRYIGWPGQAVSYKIGELTIRDLRTEAASKLGEKFDLKAFHDKVLSNGSVPLFILQEEVRAWVSESLQ